VTATPCARTVLPETFLLNLRATPCACVLLLCRAAEGPKGADKQEFLYNDKRAAAAPSYVHGPEGDEEAVPQHEDIHGPEGVLYAHPNTQRSNSLRLNYLGLAAVACVILWLVLKDKLGGNKPVVSPGGLPAHNRAGTRRW
jgi:hypothetical protein